MNLFKSAWVDTIFEGRNQEYGAYVLRKENGKVTLLALLIGALVFSFAISAPVISKMLAKEEVVVDTTPIDTKIVMMDILEPIKPPEEIVQPIVQKQTKTIQEVVKHTPPVIVEKETVEQEVTSVEDLKDKIAGNKNIEASDDGEVVIDGTHSEVKVDAEIVENPNQIYTAVEVMPDYPGGINEFRKFVSKNYDTSDIGRALKGQVVVQFVVEPDGSLTNFKILKDLGYGTGDRAIKAIKRAKKWKPGNQNGKPVRVLFSFPMMIDIRE